MSTKAAAPTEPTETPSENLSLAELGKRMSKRQKASSTPATAKTAGAPAKPATSSEQAEEGKAGVLSNPETEDSTALAAEANAEAAKEAETAETADAAAPEGDAGGEDESEGGDEAEKAKRGEKPLRDLQKRVGKLTEQRDAAREEVQEMRRELADLREQIQTAKPAPAATHPGDGGFATDRTVKEIDETLGGVEAFLSWADENPDGGTFSDGAKTYELTADEVKAYRRRCDREARTLSAKREARLETLRNDFDAKRQAAHAEAVRLYPWIEQKTSAEFQEALAVIRENPDVLKRPDFELVVARQVAGTRLEREALKKLAKPAAGAAKPRGGTTPPLVVTHSPSAAPRSSAPKAAEASAAEKQFVEAGKISGNDLSKLLAQRRQARREAASA
ncbi:MAG: hypothetical protein IPK15_24215 [Verrucomicrobia bacterium]|nr:hypothetical protein [Verrucomicrobiota bacterium]